MQVHQLIDLRSMLRELLRRPWHQIGRGHPIEQSVTDLAVVMPGAVRHPVEVRECGVERERQPS